MGDIIGSDLKVIDVKKGGFNVIYIFYSNRWKRMVTVKSFQDKYLKQEEVVKPSIMKL